MNIPVNSFEFGTNFIEITLAQVNGQRGKVDLIIRPWRNWDKIQEMIFIENDGTFRNIIFMKSSIMNSLILKILTGGTQETQ